MPIFHRRSSGCLFRGLPQEYFILLRYSDHAGHGIALSSLPGIAGGLRYLITSCRSSAAITVTAGGYNCSAGGIVGFMKNNVSIADCNASGDISLSVPDTADAISHAGGIAGYSGTGGAAAGVSGCVILRCYFTGNVGVEGNYPYAGGITGYNYGGAVIRECYAAGGTVTAIGKNLPYAGGVSGYNSRTAEGDPDSPSLIENCYSSMTVQALAFSPQALAGGITGANAAGAAVSKCYALGNVSARVEGDSGAGTGGSLGVPASANAGGIAGAQYFGSPSIKNCVALNREIKGLDSGSGAAFNVRRIAGPGTGGDTPAWEANIANVDDLAPAPESDTGGYDGGDCAAQPAQSAYEALGWDFVSVWNMAGDGYPVLKWRQ